MKDDSDKSVYLSRLILNPHSRQVWSELSNPYEMHRTLLQAFPSVTDEKTKAREKFGVLYRADMDDRRDRVIVYVQSYAKPDWSSINSHQDYLHEEVEPPNPAIKNITEIYRRFQNGRIFRFRLAANPSKREPGRGKGRGRQGLLKQEDQIAWLKRKGESGGFRIIDMVVVPIGFQNSNKKDNKRHHGIKLFGVRFEGILSVTDPEIFKQTLISGIGSAKAFGFGLLSLAKIS